MIRKIIFSALAVGITGYILSSGVHIDNSTTKIFIWNILLLSLVLGIINHTIRPVLKIITLPINIITLGFFGFIINTLMIILADKIVPGFYIDSFFYAALFGIILSAIHQVFSIFED